MFQIGRCCARAQRLCGVECLGVLSSAPYRGVFHRSFAIATSMANGDAVGAEVAFIEAHNPVTGKREWAMTHSHYNYTQEIARSGYADMLHDTERNELYFAALKKVIQEFRATGRPVHVLDIGTGSGLLSMMAAQLGADTIYACEAFKPMYHCALGVINENGYGDRIHVIPKRSTELKIGVDMPQRANILITEVFDTELIGEGAIGVFNHAHKELLEPGAAVIPNDATMYVQLVQSKFIRRWHQLFLSKQSSSKPEHSTGDDMALEIPKAMTQCPGRPEVHDLQLKEIHHSSFYTITEPLVAFKFDFSRPGLQLDEQREMIAESPGALYTDAIFVWWSLNMTKGKPAASTSSEALSSENDSSDGATKPSDDAVDAASSLVLSCAPPWGHPDGNELQWRDHWMQAIYYPSRAERLEPGQLVKIRCRHDEYSLWFDTESLPVAGDAASSVERPLPRPDCSCGVHRALSRSRIGMMSDRHWMATARAAMLQKLVAWRSSTTNAAAAADGPVVATIGDSALLAVFAAMAGRRPAVVHCLESNRTCAEVVHSIAVQNGIDSRLCDSADACRAVVSEKRNGPTLAVLVAETVEEIIKDWMPSGESRIQYDMIFAEPFFLSNLLPWHGLRYWYVLSALRKAGMLSPSVLTSPIAAHITLVPVEFEDLYKIRVPVKQTCGFTMKGLDSLIETHISGTDVPLEPQPLWEYPGVALSRHHTVLSIDLTRDQLVTLDDTMAPHGDDASKPLRCNGDSKNESEVLRRTSRVHFECPGSCNGVAVWVDWQLDAATTISSGLLQPAVAGRKLLWSAYHRQGVQLFADPITITPGRNLLDVSVAFDVATGELMVTPKVVDWDGQDGQTCRCLSCSSLTTASTNTST